MNKKIFLTLIAVMTAVIMTGCGKDETEMPVNKGVENVEEEKSETNVNTETDTSAPIEAEEVASFECMEEIKNASPESGLMQIDDMIFEYGCSVSDVLEVISHSECSYTMAKGLSEDELVISGDFQDLSFHKNDNYYFGIRAVNYDNETVKLGDCTVKWIAAFNNTKGNAFYAGFDDEQGNITYDFVKELMSDYEARENTSYDSKGEKRIEVAYSLPKDTLADGYLHLCFVFESTGELRSFAVSNAVYPVASGM